MTYLAGWILGWVGGLIFPQEEAFPSPASKKGLSVQMVEDAIHLGVRHATVNIQIGHLLATRDQAGVIPYEMGEDRLNFSRTAIRRLDRKIAELSSNGIVVYAILLARATGDAHRNRFILHDGYERRAPNRISAFATSTPERAKIFRGMIRFLAERYQRPDRQFGRIWGWIVGNEVNSHWWWYNLGEVDMQTVVQEYERAVRIVHQATTQGLSQSRTYISLEHHWAIRYPPSHDLQAFPGRDFLVEFSQTVKSKGDFPWHLAFHPYPEKLSECRTWLDKSAVDEDRSPRITFKNLEVLQDFMRREELLFAGKPRSIILSEQGFHAAKRPNGERDQAAAFAYAWEKVRRLDGIHAFIYHRHVDHADEGGLRLGLWTRRQDSDSKPSRRRKIYQVFLHCDREDAAKWTKFALPLVGVESWDEIL